MYIVYYFYLPITFLNTAQLHSNECDIEKYFDISSEIQSTAFLYGCTTMG